MDLDKLYRPYAGIRSGASTRLPLVEALELAGADVRYSGDGDEAQIRCPTPGHEDDNPSASVNTRTGLWYCHGCGAKGNLRQLLGFLLEAEDADALASRVDLEDGGQRSAARAGGPAAGWPPAQEGFEPSPTELGREFVYELEPGEEHYTVTRGNDSFPDSPRFWASRPAKGGGRAQNLPPREERIPYRLPELEAADPAETVYLVEGEKDAEAVRAAGGVATTAFGGANGWRAGWGRLYLGGRQVVIVADRDHGPGIHAALRRSEDIAPHAASCRIVGARVGKDAADHLHNGFGLDEFVPYEPTVGRQITRAPTADGRGEGGPATDDLVWYSGAATPEVPRLEWIAYPFVLGGGTATHFIGRPKVAKTTYLLALAEAVTKGRDFLGHPTVKMPVVYLSEQAPFSFVQQLHPGLLHNPDFHFALKPENSGRVWDDFVRLGVQKCEEVGSQLLIFDTVGKFARFAAESEYSASQVRKVLDALDLARNKGISYLLAIHTNKKGGNSDEIVGSSSGSHAWDAEADLLLKVTRKTGENRGRLFNEGRIQGAISSWTIEYDPLTHDLRLVAEGDDHSTAPASPKRHAAEELIKTLLKDGPIPARELNDAVGELGISRGSLVEAKKALGVVTKPVEGQHMVGYEEQS